MHTDIFDHDRTRRFMLRMVFVLSCLIGLLDPAPASAWGYQGHKVVGSIADQLLKPNAKQQVQQILGFDLRTAGPWADCVKSVVRHDDLSFHYEVDPDHLEYEVPCTRFNSREERARIVDYAKRNWSTCSYTPDGFERGCHNTFHFDDLAVQRNGFDRNFQGQNEHDLVAAIGAAVAVLSDKPVPPPFPFSIKDKKEALFLLAHLIGDLHQPLHVGSVYLDANGKRVDPDTAHKIDPATETAGGNAIQDQNISLHHEWDDIPTDIGEAATTELLSAAKSLPASQGGIGDWPVAWASDSILVSHDAFAGLTFKLTQTLPKNKWTVAFDDHVTYLRSMDAIKRNQLAKGGARLAEFLNAIWP
jgi:hypothetical protein